MGPRRHPRGILGVQNEPKCVPEAPRRRPRPSKKRPGGKKLDLVVFYRLFKRPQVTRRHTPGSRNNLPVREVNRTIIFTNTNSSAKSTAYGANPNTHWCARGHGADLKAKASCRRPQKYKKWQKCKKCKNENLQRLIILEGFMQNGYHHLFQRIFLHIIAPVKIIFRHFFRIWHFLTFESLKTVLNQRFEVFGLC